MTGLDLLVSILFFMLLVLDSKRKFEGPFYMRCKKAIETGSKNEGYNYFEHCDALIELTFLGYMFYFPHFIV